LLHAASNDVRIKQQKGLNRWRDGGNDQKTLRFAEPADNVQVIEQRETRIGWMWRKCERRDARPGSKWLDGGLMLYQNGNSIPNWVYAPALVALEGIVSTQN
jgi:hypothetical protein